MIINKIIIVIFIIYFIYFVLSYLPLLFKKKDIINDSKKLNKFLILIPCRNEEKVITRIVESINNQNYDKKYYNYVLLINNTTDNSINICKKNKYNYLLVNDVLNKGDVLRYAFNYYKDSNYLGYIIFDCDNILDSNFLKNMNNYYEQYKYDIIQGYRLGLNKKNILMECYEIYYIIQNIGYNEFKMKQRLNATSNGTGYFISKKYIEEYGFNTKSNTEDIELNILVSLNHKRVGYIENAITYDEYVSDYKTSIIQRKRWSRGIIDCFKYIKPLFKDFIKYKNINSLDNICILIGFFMWFPVILNWIILSIFNIKLCLLIIILLYIGLILFNIVLVLRSKIKIKKRTILVFPIFLLSFFYVQIISLIKKDYSWKKIDHGN